MVSRLRARQRAVQVKRVGGTAVALVLLAAVLVGGRELLRRSVGSAPRFGGLTCQQVMPLFQAYHDGTLDAELARKVGIHLAECPHCGPAYRRMFGLALAPSRHGGTRYAVNWSGRIDAGPSSAAVIHGRHPRVTGVTPLFGTLLIGTPHGTP